LSQVGKWFEDALQRTGLHLPSSCHYCYSH